MIETQVIDYIKEKGKTTIPEIQAQFGLGYKTTRDLFSKLEKEENIVLKRDLFFEYKKEAEETPIYYKLILWDCIKNQSVNMTHLIEVFSLSYLEISQVLKWMIKKKYCSSKHELLITKKEFTERYGNADLFSGELSKLYHFPLPKEYTIEEIVELEEILLLRFECLEEKIETELPSTECLTTKKFYNALFEIIENEPDITKENIIETLQKRFYLAFISDIQEDQTIPNLIDNFYQMSDEQFAELKKVILS